MTAEAQALPGLDEPLEPGDVFFSLKLDGHPQHKARHRSRLVMPKGKKPFIHNYPEPETEKFEGTLAKAAALRMARRSPTSEPVCLLVIADREIPVSWPRQKRQAALEGRVLPTSKPDWDNHGKITDALSGVVWLDDAQVVDARVIKRYAVHPALRIEVREFLPPKR
jgi:Holliday junction resolvase RusA-like endonuclease